MVVLIKSVSSYIKLYIFQIRLRQCRKLVLKNVFFNLVIIESLIIYRSYFDQKNNSIISEFYESFTIIACREYLFKLTINHHVINIHPLQNTQKEMVLRISKLCLPPRTQQQRGSLILLKQVPQQGRLAVLQQTQAQTSR